MKHLLFLLMLSLSIVAAATNSATQNFQYENLSITTMEQNGSKIQSSNFSTNETPSTYAPMLVEGRTWWYAQRHYIFPNLFTENAISVGEEVEINGKNWHEINVVNNGICRDGEWAFNIEPVTIAYMREEDDKIYTIYLYDQTELGRTEGISDYYGYSEEEFKAMLTYQYKNAGESYPIECLPSEFERIVSINNITQITNSGREYTLYESTIDKGPDVSFIEGIGCITNRFFFAPDPAYCAAMDMYDWPQLRYVTENGEIIYEGIGGYKLWEASGVENVYVDDDGSCRWFNLQGMEIDNPTTPGIYIRSSRSGNEKVYIR